MEEDSQDFAYLRLIVKYMQMRFEKDLKERQKMEGVEFVKVGFFNHR